MSNFIDDLVASMNSAVADHRAETKRDIIAHQAVCEELIASIRTHFGTTDPEKVTRILTLILSSIARASAPGPGARLYAALAISSLVLDQIMQEIPPNGH